MSSTLPISPLMAGACLNTNTESGYTCAYQPSDCKELEVFVSPLWLSQNHPTWATKCGSQPEVRGIPGLGRCQSAVEDYLCTSDRSACALPRSFERPAEGCNLLQDAYAGTNYEIPQFGRCAHSRNPSRDFCAWSKVDCQLDGTANEEFIFQVADPSMGHVSHSSCGCHQVHVGACVYTSPANPMDSVWFCAVSEEVCGSTPGEEEFKYYPVLEFQAYSNTSCRLCDGTIVEVPPPVPPESAPTSSPVPFSPPTSPTQSFSAGSSSKRKGNNVGFVIGFVVGGLVAVVIMSFIIVVSTRRRATTAGDSATTSPHTADDDIEVEELPGDEYSTSSY